MSSVDQAVHSMQAKFNPAAAAGLDLIFGFHITDEDKHYALIVKDNTCQLQDSENPDASVTLIMDSVTLKGIVSGETDGMQAFMGGKLRAEGNMMLAMKLSELFPV